MADSVSQEQLRALIERLERMHEERKAIADDIREIYAEARGNGFDVPALKAVLKIRGMDDQERLEREALIDLYLSALGMQAAPIEDEDEEPRAPAPAHAREIIEEFGAETEEILDTEPLPASTPAAQGVGDLVVASSSSSGRTESSADGQTNSPDHISDLPKMVSAGQSAAALSGSTGPYTAATMVRDADAPTEGGDRDAPQVGTQARPADTPPEPGKLFEPSGPDAPTPAQKFFIKALRPDRLHPEACGSSGGKSHCFTCRKAAEAVGRAAA